MHERIMERYTLEDACIILLATHVYIVATNQYLEGDHKIL